MFAYLTKAMNLSMLSMINFLKWQVLNTESAYHPQTNGLDEWMNQTVTKAIAKYLNPEQEDWDEHIDAILFSYRTSVHASTKFTPLYLMYGREAQLYFAYEARIISCG